MAKTPEERVRRPPAGSQSIRRAMEVVRYVAGSREEGRRLKEVAEALGLHTATAHRLLTTLVYCGLLLQKANTKIYRLGPELMSLSAMANSQLTLQRLLEPALDNIARETGDTVYLQVGAGDETVCLARTLGAYSVAALVLDVGSRLPMGVGAAGLAFLTFMGEDEREELLGRRAVEFKKYDLRPEMVREAVAESQRVGYALQDGLSREGISGVGVLLVDEKENEAVAAVSVIALTSRMDARRKRQIAEVIRGACSNLQGLNIYPKQLPKRGKAEEKVSVGSGASAAKRATNRTAQSRRTS